MEPRQNYVLVGSFVMGTLALFMAFLLWLAHRGEHHDYHKYIIYFGESVTGLNPGAAVKFRGLQVGKVDRIEIDPTNSERIMIYADIADGTPLKQDTIATLKTQGFTGVAFVELNGGSQSSPALEKPKSGSYPIIASRESDLSKVFNAAPELIDKVNHLADQVNQVVSPKNVANISETLANVQDFTEGLETNKANLNQFMAALPKLTASLTNTAQKFDAMSAGLDKNLNMLLKQSNDIAIHALAVTKQLEQFSGQGSKETLQLLNETKQAAREIKELSRSLKANPSRVLYPVQQEGYKVNE